MRIEAQDAQRNKDELTHALFENYTRQRLKIPDVKAGHVVAQVAPVLPGHLHHASQTNRSLQQGASHLVSPGTHRGA